MAHDALCDFVDKHAPVLERSAAVLQHVVRVARQRRNSEQLVHRLPPELVSRIFTDLVSENTPEGDQNLVTATHVCRRWRLIALDDSSLWTGVNVVATRKHEHQAVAFIERSANRLIDVKFFGFMGLLNVLRMALGFRRASRAHRIRSFVVGHRDENVVPTLMWTIAGSWYATHLHTLHILGTDSILDPEMERFASVVSGMEAFDCVPAEDLEWTPTPALRSLRLHGYHLNWKSRVYRNLTELELRTPDAYPISQKRLLEILKACPDLERLHLLLADPDEPFVETGDFIWDVSLPKLVKLDLHMISPGSVAKILEHLVLPPTTRYQLSSEEVHDVSILPMDLTRLPGLEGPTIIRADIFMPRDENVREPVTQVSCTHATIGDAVDPVLKLALYAWETTGRSFATLPAVLDLSALETLVVTGLAVPLDDLADLPWPALLRQLPALRTLRLVKPDGEEFLSAIDALVTDDPVPVPPGTARVPLLEEVEASGVELTEELRVDLLDLFVVRKEQCRALPRLLLPQASGVEGEWVQTVRSLGTQVILGDAY
ncbi:uncharacterized protein BXZ73DRAFT_54144 [Epithele typhae]|uniref:uncharacterized protein n=1 Tax=Epithele typhae TaxID=378194 RepID=UPI002007C0EC|nr:uncharacterized protein BXZ73DRAFT_54144 [Epithele typhae]KAH9915781.1 hypothetical protein BXZ73DRAFT_54144 [Epithele typhae]